MRALVRRVEQRLWLLRMRIRKWWYAPGLSEIDASIANDRAKHKRGARAKIIRRQRETTAALRGDRSAA